MFWFGDIAGRKMVKRSPSAYMKNICDMSIGRFRTFVILAVAVGMLLLIYKEVASAVSLSGIAFQIFSTSTKGLSGYTANSTVTMSNNILSILAIYSVVIVSNNKMRHCLKKRDLLLLTTIPMYCVAILLQGQRGDLINVFISTIFIIFIMNYKNEGSSRKKNVKLAGSFIKYILIVLVVFYLLRLTIAKPGQENLSFLDTISGYVGAQIDLLNDLVKNKNISYPYFGYESFNYIYSFLEKIGVYSNLPKIRFPFKAYNGLGCNVYTFFKRPYVDFGLLGTWIVSLLCGFVFSYFYNKYIKVINASRNYLFYLMIYAYFVNKVATAFFDDYMTLLLAPNTIIKMILMIGVDSFMYMRVKWGGYESVDDCVYSEDCVAIMLSKYPYTIPPYREWRYA